MQSNWILRNRKPMYFERKRGKCPSENDRLRAMFCVWFNKRRNGNGEK